MLTEPQSDFVAAQPATDSGVKVISGMSSDDYHGEYLHTSSSQLVHVLQTPAHFKHHMQKVPDEESDLMKLGTAVHCALLEPGEFSTRYVLAPRKYDKRLKADKAEIAALEAAYPNKTLVTPEEAEKLHRVVAGIRQHRMASTLLSCPGESELSIFWRDPLTGLNLKVRIDRLAHYGVGNSLVEVKTTEDASRWCFEKKVVEMDYDMRAIMYQDALEKAYGLHAQIVWLVIERDTGFVTTYKPPLEMIQRGKSRYEEARLALAKARASNHWPSYQSGDEIEEIKLPRWAK